MISLEKLRAVEVIITHENCADGLASAMFLHDAIPNAKIRFIQYGTKQHLELEATQHMLFCDFSPHPDNVQAFVDAGAIVLDHHKTAKAIVEAFGDDGVFGDEIANPGVCGAVLAYREVWAPMFARMDSGDLSKSREFGEKVALLAGIRDTWLNQHPQWEEACIMAEAMRFFPHESWLSLPHPFEEANRQWWGGRLEVGGWLIKKNDLAVSKALKGAHRFKSSRGTKVVLFSGIKLSSDAAESVGDEADLVVGFDYVEVSEEKATLVFSTRSHAEFDCAAFCKAHGGGGHTKAAGFSVKFDLKNGAQDPYSTFELVLERYEASLAKLSV